MIHKYYRTNENPSTVGGAEAGAGAGAGADAGAVGIGEARLSTRTTLQAAPSVPPVTTVVARRLPSAKPRRFPSAQATPISSEEAMMYETAAAEVTSNAV